MLDIKFIRENKEIVQEGAKKKLIDIDISKLIERLEEDEDVNKVFHNMG